MLGSRSQIVAAPARRALPIAGVIVAVGVLLAACGGGSSATSSTTSSSPNSSTTTPSLAPEITSSTVVLNGQSVKVPTEAGTTPIPNTNGQGQQIILSPHGFLPSSLIASLKESVTWTNLTSKPVTISFHYHGTPVSYTLAPGGAFSYYFPTLDNFVYSSSTGYHGSVSVGAFQSGQ